MNLVITSVATYILPDVDDQGESVGQVGEWQARFINRSVVYFNWAPGMSVECYS